MDCDVKEQLKIAIIAAINGNWETAHRITQTYSDSTANWLHAVLHKIEGDAWNSKYWYAKCDGKSYTDFSNTKEELDTMLRELN